MDKLVPGESGRIVRLHGRGAIRRRLVDMGFTRGAEIEVVKLSPLGDPVEYRLRGYHLSLRKSEARMIEVELSESTPRERESDRPARSQVPLNRCNSGQRVEIIHTRGGRKLAQKLQELGLKPGMALTVVRNDFLGPILLENRDQSRMVIGKGMARHILVKPA